MRLQSSDYKELIPEYTHSIRCPDTNRSNYSTVHFWNTFEKKRRMSVKSDKCKSTQKSFCGLAS